MSTGEAGDGIHLRTALAARRWPRWSKRCSRRSSSTAAMSATARYWRRLPANAAWSAKAVLRYLESADEMSEAVRGGAEEARRLGISGVPFFIFNNTAGRQPGRNRRTHCCKVMRQAAQEDAAAA
jgi:hypothetical protein